jgi:hypothetical protein
MRVGDRYSCSVARGDGIRMVPRNSAANPGLNGTMSIGKSSFFVV